MGTEFKFTAAVKNTSDEVLRIAQVGASCSCTDVGIDQKEIPAGGQAELRGVFRAKPGEQRIGSIVTVDVVGVRTGQFLSVKYPVSAELVSTVSITTSFHDAAPIPDSGYFEVGSVVVKSQSDDDLVVEVVPSNFEAKSVRISPTKSTLKKGETVTMDIEVDRMAERRGSLKVSIDEGREVHTIPLRVRMVDNVTVSPTTIVLGNVILNGGQVESTFPAHLSIRGKSLSVSTIVIRSLPEVLRRPRLAQVDEEEWALDCEILLSGEHPKVQGEIHLDVISPTQVVLQSIKIPIVGFVKPR